MGFGRMCGRVLLAAAACMTLGAAAPAQHKPGNPLARHLLPSQEYGFGPVRLGISLGEFRKLAPPLRGGTPPSLICSSDPAAAKLGSDSGLGLNPIENAAHVIRCGYFALSAASPDSWQPTPLPAPLVGASDVTFSFAADPVDGVAKLYLIRAVGSLANLKPAIAHRREEFGPPSSYKEREVETPFGTYLRTEAVWENAESEISIEAPFSGKDHMGILYTEHRLTESVAEAKLPRPAARN